MKKREDSHLVLGMIIKLKFKCNIQRDFLLCSTYMTIKQEYKNYTKRSVERSVDQKLSGSDHLLGDVAEIMSQ